MHDAPAAESKAGADADAEQSPMPRRRKRWPWIVSACAVVVVAIIVAAMLRQSSLSAPRDLAVQYLEAIAAGDVAEANALAPDSAYYGLPAEGSMDDATPISDIWVSESSTTTNVQTLSGDEFLAEGFEVRYALDGETYEGDVWLERIETSWLTSEWRIRDSLAREGTVHAYGEAPVPVSMQVAGEAATLEGDEVSWSAPLYPGVYQVVVEEGELVTGGEARLAVADQGGLVTVLMGQIPDAPDGAPIRVEPTPAMGDAAASLATEQLTACVERATADDGSELYCDGSIIGLSSTATAEVQQGADVAWAVAGDAAAEADEGVPWAWNVDVAVEATATTPSGVVTTERFQLTELVAIGGATVDELGITYASGWFER